MIVKKMKNRVIISIITVILLLMIVVTLIFTIPQWLGKYVWDELVLKMAFGKPHMPESVEIEESEMFLAKPDAIVYQGEKAKELSGKEADEVYAQFTAATEGAGVWNPSAYTSKDILL